MVFVLLFVKANRNQYNTLEYFPNIQASDTKVATGARYNVSVALNSYLKFNIGNVIDKP